MCMQAIDSRRKQLRAAATVCANTKLLYCPHRALALTSQARQLIASPSRRMQTLGRARRRMQALARGCARRQTCVHMCDFMKCHAHTCGAARSCKQLQALMQPTAQELGAELIVCGIMQIWALLRLTPEE